MPEREFPTPPPPPEALGESVEHDGLDAFLAAAQSLEVTAVILRHIDEHRPVPLTDYVAPDKIRRCELLAYVGRTLHKCVLEDTRATELVEPLKASGLQVVVRSGNLT